MPELPEVETTLRGIKPYIIHQKVKDIIIRHPHLRWPIPRNLKIAIKNKKLLNLKRRAKYLLFEFSTGTMILHLGMSGKLQVLTQTKLAGKHDHVDIEFANGKILRLTDPRRFGALLFTTEKPEQHALLSTLGPEPLTIKFNGDYLWQASRNKKMAVKTFIMNSKIVAGVGNIYATEALFIAGINPQTPAGKISHKTYEILADAIKSVLKHAIQKGGTTLKDFAQSDGSPGYFYIELLVYGRAGEPCVKCKTILRSFRIGQRNTVYCPSCQP